MWGENLNNFAIEGPGKIDGAGLTTGDPSSGGGDKQVSLKTCNTEADCTDSVNRYIVMTSQATAQDRNVEDSRTAQKAKKLLGNKFDIRQFMKWFRATAASRSARRS